ncbi:hypothetical protein GDO86_012152 [Hymenochirus boettgeri]|uniref:Globin domain-containing protein n=1 Tax=Hymenochirus boettgeri TaxID=247094 RepID=A0A8T2ILE8_9PIPI|nr:hypothetical protein GDO86_012152 [Hymenochirus boettgeri]KAG8433689.1 hypothetical protein GDO86_012152 [Hymenochirus boettgeri]
MTLTDKMKAEVAALWAKAEPQAKTLGDEVVNRMLITFPQYKLYFEDKPDMGEKIMAALGEAVQHIDNLSEDLSALNALEMSEKLYQLLLPHTFLVTLAVHFPTDFTSSMYAAWVHFFDEIKKILFSKEK